MQNLQSISSLSNLHKPRVGSPSHLYSLGTQMESFDSTTGWSVSGGTIATEGTIKKEGTNSLKVTVTAGQPSAAITRTVSLNLSSVNNFTYSVYCDPATFSRFTNQWIIFYLSSSASFTSFYSYQHTARLHQGWNDLIIPKNDMTTSTGESWSNTMIRERFRVYSDSVGENIVYFDDLRYDNTSRPRVIITFDDNWLSSYTEGFTYMQTKNLVGTSYLIRDRIDTANYCTTAQLQEMYNAGWDLGTHGNINLTTLASVEECETEIGYNRQVLLDNNWTRDNCHLHYAYPNGGYNDNAITALSNLGFLTARTIINRIQANVIDEPYMLARQSIINTNTLAVAKAYVDDVIDANAGCLISNFHKLEASPAFDTEWSIVDFRSWCDYVAAKRDSGLIDVLTLSSWDNDVV